MQVSVGVVIGMIIINDFETGTTYNEISHMYTTSCLDAFAAGILIYIGLVEMIAEEFSKKNVIRNPILKVCMIFSLLIGLSCMSIIGIWA
jgi:zinc transporter 1/2/3